MRILILAACCFIMLGGYGQSVNEKITLQILQPSLLRVNAGDDLNLSESGSVIIGESLFVSGGTPDFSYRWSDEQNMEYFGRTPEVFSSGKYLVTVVDQNSCSAFDSLSVYDFGTGITAQNAKMSIHLRLDSQNELMFIETPPYAGKVSLLLISAEGKVIYTFDRVLSNTPFIHSIWTGTFNRGIYFIELRSDQWQTVKKVVLP